MVDGCQLGNEGLIGMYYNCIGHREPQRKHLCVTPITLWFSVTLLIKLLNC